MKHKYFNSIKGLIKTFLFPIILWLFMNTLIEIRGGSNIFATTACIQDIFQSSVMLAIIAIAVALPLASGRWDYAPGSIVVLTGIIAGNIAVDLGLNIGMLVVLSIVVAVLLALFEGVLYIVFRVPTMIISLGVVMLYEALSGLVYDGAGIRLFMYEDLAILARQPYCYIVLAIVLVLFWFLMKYTKFGFDSRSIGNNALLAINNGVNEKKTIILTYVIVGCLLGVAALINASKAVVAPESNLSSTYLMFSSMGAVLVGLHLSRYSNMSLGILSGTISMSVFTKGLTAYGLPGSLSNILLGIFIVSFMGITTNWNYILEKIGKKQHET